RNTLFPVHYIDYWKTYGANVLTKGFPDTLFNFPAYVFPTKFGEDLTEEDDWFAFRHVINRVRYNNGVRSMEVNDYSTFGGELLFKNVTVNSPQVYLLS